MRIWRKEILSSTNLQHKAWPQLGQEWALSRGSMVHMCELAEGQDRSNRQFSLPQVTQPSSCPPANLSRILSVFLQGVTGEPNC